MTIKFVWAGSCRNVVTDGFYRKGKLSAGT
jgi:hypothetical protein